MVPEIEEAVHKELFVSALVLVSLFYHLHFLFH